MYYPGLELIPSSALCDNGGTAEMRIKIYSV